MSPRPTALLQHNGHTEIASMLLTADATAMCTGQSYGMTQQLAYAPVRQISHAPSAAKHSASSGTSNLESAPNSATSSKSAQRSVINITARQAPRVIGMIFTLQYMENMLYGDACANPVQNGSTCIVAGDASSSVISEYHNVQTRFRTEAHTFKQSDDCSRKSLQKRGAAGRACTSVAQREEPAKAWRSRKSLHKRGAAGRACTSVTQHQRSVQLHRWRTQHRGELISTQQQASK